MGSIVCFKPDPLRICFFIGVVMLLLAPRGLLDQIKQGAGLPPGPITAQGLMSDDRQPSLMNTDPVSLGGFNTRRDNTTEKFQKDKANYLRQQQKLSGTPMDDLLDSIYLAEGDEKATIPFGFHSGEFKKRVANKESIPYGEARQAVRGNIEMRINQWEENRYPAYLTKNEAKTRKLFNANPQKKPAIKNGKWAKDFIGFLGEIYAPSIHPGTPAEQLKNPNWIPNVSSRIEYTK